MAGGAAETRSKAVCPICVRGEGYLCAALSHGGGQRGPTVGKPTAFRWGRVPSGGVREREGTFRVRPTHRPHGWNPVKEAKP